MIEALADLYCAYPSDIARYISKRPATRNDVRTINATLKNIADYHPHRKYWVRSDPYGFAAPKLYGLSEYGEKYANEILGCRGREFEVKDLEHEHIITRFHLCAKEFAEKQGWGFEWVQTAIDHKKLINPDALMTLTTPQGSFVFSVEPERQKFNENLLKKAKKYHSVFGKPECKELFGVEKIRIIFVVLSERKRTFMLQEFAKEYPYRMFWFTTIDLFEKDMGGEIFKTPKDFKTASYSFNSL